MISKMKQSVLCRGVLGMEEDCRRFVSAIDRSVAEKFVFPSDGSASRFVELSNRVYRQHFDIFANRSQVSDEEAKLRDELRKNTTFGRFYAQCLAQGEGPNPPDENYSLTLYLYHLWGNQSRIERCKN